MGYKSNVVIALMFCVICGIDCVIVNSCNFTKHANLNPNTYKLLTSVLNQGYETSDADYNYAITICGTITQTLTGVGAIQSKMKGDGSLQSWILGSTLDADIRSSDEWILLSYMSGDSYANACDQQPRRTNIMIMCDPDAPYGRLQFIHEEARTNKTTDCSYLFELDHAAMCNVEMLPSCNTYLFPGMSVGTVLLICFFSLLAAYCLFGSAYRRFVVGARGIQTIPNFEFWSDFGEMQADGCDYVFRAGNMAFVPLSVTAEEAHPTDYSAHRQTLVTQQPSATAASKPYRGGALATET